MPEEARRSVADASRDGATDLLAAGMVDQAKKPLEAAPTVVIEANIGATSQASAGRLPVKPIVSLARSQAEQAGDVTRSAATIEAAVFPPAAPVV